MITTELSGHDVSRGNLWDTVRHGETLPPAVLYVRQFSFSLNYFEWILVFNLCQEYQIDMQGSMYLNHLGEKLHE